ncbi:MAG: phosphoadenylyl-sulfate reductase [Pseudomonadota bacterium]
MTNFTQSDVDRLNEAYEGKSAEYILEHVLGEEFEGYQVSAVSSFGTESAVLLALIADVNPATDVIFVNTGKLFGETLTYRDTLVKKLGLAHVRTFMPRPAHLAEADHDGTLWYRQANRCCFIRKVEPLERALTGVDVWISGRKSFQAETRHDMPIFELQDGRLKVNPLASFSREQINGYFDAYELPRHPLEAQGYPSIGCMPCTTPVADGEDYRAGRWRNSAKQECGIHLSGDEVRRAAFI